MNEDINRTEAETTPTAAVHGASKPPSRSLFWTVFPSIMLPMFLAVADQTIVATALPTIATDLGEVERVSWVVVSYLIANTIAAPVYGRLGDSFGRRHMMLTALDPLYGRIGTLRARSQHRNPDRDAGAARIRRRWPHDLVASAGRRDHPAAGTRPLSGLSRGRVRQFQHVRTGRRRLSHPSIRLAVDLPGQRTARARCRASRRCALQHNRATGGGQRSMLRAWCCS